MIIQIACGVSQQREVEVVRCQFTVVGLRLTIYASTVRVALWRWTCKIKELCARFQESYFFDSVLISCNTTLLCDEFQVSAFSGVCSQIRATLHYCAVDTRVWIFYKHTVQYCTRASQKWQDHWLGLLHSCWHWPVQISPIISPCQSDRTPSAHNCDFLTATAQFKLPKCYIRNMPLTF